MADSFALLLRRHRIRARLSQENLAELAGVSADEISALERGTRRAPQRATLGLLITALGLGDNARSEIEAAAKIARARRRRTRQIGNNLPTQLTSFVNREREVAEIKKLLHSVRLLTLVGTGGAGKTRCAIKIGTEVLDRFTDGVWLAELASISSSASV